MAVWVPVPFWTFSSGGAAEMGVATVMDVISIVTHKTRAKARLVMVGFMGVLLYEKYGVCILPQCCCFVKFHL
jgi:hypothetical protein